MFSCSKIEQEQLNTWVSFQSAEQPLLGQFSVSGNKPHYPKGEGGRPAYPLMAMLRVHLMQNWFGYSDPAMEEALYETTILRQFAGLSLERIPDETTILNFRRKRPAKSPSELQH